MNGHNFTLPDLTQSAAFSIPHHQIPDGNGIAFANPEMMMMMPGQPMNFVGAPVQDTNGHGLAHGHDKDITAGKISPTSHRPSFLFYFRIV